MLLSNSAPPSDDFAALRVQLAASQALLDSVRSILDDVGVSALARRVVVLEKAVRHMRHIRPLIDHHPRAAALPGSQSGDA
jgi:hypothetical protein